MSALVLWWWLACTQSDPQLMALQDAVEHWEAGAEAMDDGDGALALQHFRKARQVRPSDSLLGAWEARAMAEQGDVQGAIAVLDEVLGELPAFAEARYNRAAYKARLGDAPGAAADLRRAIEDGACRGRDVLSDPDFAGLLGHPDMAFLPSDVLQVTVEAPDESAFWGSEVAVVMRIIGAKPGPVAVRAEAVDGPLSMLSVFEDARDSTEGPYREITWSMRVAGAGPVVMGPFHVSSGDHIQHVEAVRFEAKAPPGKEEANIELPVSFATVLEVGGQMQPASMRYDGDRLFVKYQAGDRVVLTPPVSPPIRYEYQRGARPEWVVLSFSRDAGFPDSLKIVRQSEVLLDAKVEP